MEPMITLTSDELKTLLSDAWDDGCAWAWDRCDEWTSDYDEKQAHASYVSNVIARVIL